MSRSAVEVSVVIPVYTEEAVLPALDALERPYAVIFVDDESRDHSVGPLRQQYQARPGSRSDRLATRSPDSSAGACRSTRSSGVRLPEGRVGSPCRGRASRRQRNGRGAQSSAR